MRRERCAALCSSPAFAFPPYTENAGGRTTLFRNGAQYLETRFAGLCFQHLHTPRSLNCLASPGQRGWAKEMV